MTTATMVRQSTTHRAITVEKRFAYPPEKIWRVLTESELIIHWLMPNSFKPEVGHRFTLHCDAIGGPDGKIHCEVLEVSPPRRLRYSWTSAARAPGAAGLDTTVTWTLERVEGGTLLRLVHDGFRPGSEPVIQMMHEGWQEKIAQIACVAAMLA